MFLQGPKPQGATGPGIRKPFSCTPPFLIRRGSLGKKRRKSGDPGGPKMLKSTPHGFTRASMVEPAFLEEAQSGHEEVRRPIAYTTSKAPTPTFTRLGCLSHPRSLPASSDDCSCGFKGKPASQDEESMLGISPLLRLVGGSHQSVRSGRGLYQT